MSMKPTIPKGTRDYHPEIVLKRNYIIDIIRDVFTKYGYLEIQTPSFEKRETLSGKYGNEGDRLIFNILNSGEKVRKADIKALNENKTTEFINSISEKALRYDLTVPLARYVSQHQNEIKFPFRRFQIQNVWRADRPQKGRYQEFTQCDADIIGSDSKYLEYEMIQMYSNVFKNLGFQKIQIKVNHREILSSICRKIELNDNFIDFVTILDKLNKIGSEKVIYELKDKLGLKDKFCPLLNQIFESNNSSQALSLINEQFIDNDNSKKAFSELKTLFDLTLNNKFDVLLDLTLARGLDYYTGVIYEVVSLTNSEIGSIGGGGRYKNLTERFNANNLSGIGISFGLERIYHLMDDNNLFPEKIKSPNDILVVNFGYEFIQDISYVVSQLRTLRNVSVYPDFVKLSKQFRYADKNKYSHILIYGKEEAQEKIIKIKNLKTGEENKHNLDDSITNYKL
ncbi:MAG: histidine--tRNA ligase [Flavobacteriaceae bacterium]|nr:histidine--tRNA ligase [Flavobacteriaceae bacterium]